MSFDIVLRTDAHAALGVVNMRGIGKTRHLWLQKVIRNRELELQKVSDE